MKDSVCYIYIFYFLFFILREINSKFELEISFVILKINIIKPIWSRFKIYVELMVVEKKLHDRWTKLSVRVFNYMIAWVDGWMNYALDRWTKLSIIYIYISFRNRISVEKKIEMKYIGLGMGQAGTTLNNLHWQSYIISTFRDPG